MFAATTVQTTYDNLSFEMIVHNLNNYSSIMYINMHNTIELIPTTLLTNFVNCTQIINNLKAQHALETNMIACIFISAALIWICMCMIEFKN